MKKLFFVALCFVGCVHLAANNENANNTNTETLSENTVETLLKEQESLLISASSNNPDEDGPFKHFGVGLRGSTLGYGIEGSTTLTKNFKLRAGISGFSFSHDFDFDMDDQGLRDAVGYDPEYRTNTKLGFTNGHVLVDIHPMNYGIFHFTTGIFFGSNKIDINGAFYDPTTDQKSILLPGYTWPNLDLDGHVVEVRDGEMNGSFHMGNSIKPYFGIGLGRSLPKSRLGFMFELGALYQGDYKLKQFGKEVRLLETEHGSSFEDIDDYLKYLKWWPMLNFQITYRIF